MADKPMASFIVVIEDVIYTYETSLEDAKKTLKDEPKGKLAIYKLVEIDDG